MHQASALRHHTGVQGGIACVLPPFASHSIATPHVLLPPATTTPVRALLSPPAGWGPAPGACPHAAATRWPTPTRSWRLARCWRKDTEQIFSCWPGAAPPWLSTQTGGSGWSPCLRGASVQCVAPLVCFAWPAEERGAALLRACPLVRTEARCWLSFLCLLAGHGVEHVHSHGSTSRAAGALPLLFCCKGASPPARPCPLTRPCRSQPVPAGAPSTARLQFPVLCFASVQHRGNPVATAPPAAGIPTGRKSRKTWRCPA